MAVRLVVTDRNDRQLAGEVGPEHLSDIVERSPLPHHE